MTTQKKITWYRSKEKVLACKIASVSVERKSPSDGFLILTLENGVEVKIQTHSIMAYNQPHFALAGDWYVGDTGNVSPVFYEVLSPEEFEKKYELFA